MSASTEKGNFDLYLEAFCKNRGVSVEDALTFRTVQDVKAYYDEENESTVS